MKRLFLFAFLFIAVLILGVSPVLAQVNYPEPKGYVNDFAGIISDDVEQKIEQNLRDYEAKTTNEVAVVTVASLDGLSVEKYTIGLAEKWGVGKKDKDNGVIILVAPNERAVRVEVGYGLEYVLTDARSQQAINAMLPYFKEEKYSQGIETGVQKIIDTVGYLTPEEFKAVQQQEQAAKEKESARVKMLFLKILAGIGIVIVLIIASIIVGKKISAWKKERQRKALVRQNALETIQGVEADLREVFHDR